MSLSDQQLQNLKSDSIDDVLKKDKLEMRKEAKMALLGRSGVSMDSILFQLQTYALVGKEKEFQKRKPEVLCAVLDCMHMLLDSTTFEWREPQRTNVEIFRQQALPTAEMTQELASAIMSIWRIIRLTDRSNLAARIYPFPI